MKYLVGSFLLALALTGCNSYPAHESALSASNVNTVVATQVINFVGPMDLTI